MSEPSRPDAEPTASDPEPGAPPEAEAAAPSEPGPPSAVDDLAQGLGLMFRAAKKAVQAIDPQKIETFGREAADRASREAGRIDREKVQEFGRKAAETLNPERIEAMAEDAGRELLNVVERVAGKVEQVLKGDGSSGKSPEAAPADNSGAGTQAAQSDPGAQGSAASQSNPARSGESGAAGTEVSANGDGSSPRIRVED